MVLIMTESFMLTLDFATMHEAGTHMQILVKSVKRS